MSILQVLINVKKILAVINETYAVAKRKPEKIRLAGIRTLTSAILVQRCTGIAEVRVRIPASLIFSGFLFATA